MPLAGPGAGPRVREILKEVRVRLGGQEARRVPAMKNRSGRAALLSLLAGVARVQVACAQQGADLERMVRPWEALLSAIERPRTS